MQGYGHSMKIEDAARILEKLGHPTRLEIVRLLVRAGPDGLPVGDVQRHLGIPASTLSHHLSQLVAGGLVSQCRVGRKLVCGVEFDRMTALVAMLTENCCAGVTVTREVDLEPA
jgi:DNA-binding transcriptional ArsR family regulator